MFEKFSDSARSAVIGAQQEARDLKSARIDIEHLLLGAVSTAEGALAETLTEMGLTAEAVRASVVEDRQGDPLGADDAEALKSIGIDLDAVRDTVEASFGADAFDRAEPEERRGLFGRWLKSHIPFTNGAKKALELSLREAVHRKDGHIATEHLLLGILRAPNDAARRAIETANAPDELRRRLEELLDRAA